MGGSGCAWARPHAPRYSLLRSERYYNILSATNLRRTS
jgi:hypothetical protein